MDRELFQTLLGLKLGDGCYTFQNKIGDKNYHFKTNSKNKDYIDYKKSVMDKNNIHTREYTSYSGYKEDSMLYAFRTHNDERISIVGRMSVAEAIDNLDKLGVIMLFLDDGSLHKNKNVIHLYCNSFSEEDSKKLAQKIYNLFGGKEPKVYFDKKKDGRIYPYLYIPKETSNIINKEVIEFLNKNNIESLKYKTFLPSQTIENKE